MIIPSDHASLDGSEPLSPPTISEDIPVMYLDAPQDLYAQSELELRHERTERAIRRAQEQA